MGTSAFMGDLLPLAPSRHGDPALLLERAALEAVASSPIYVRNARAFFAFAAASGLQAADPEALRAWSVELATRYAPASLVPMLAGAKKALRGAAQELASARDAAAFSEALRAVKTPSRATRSVRRVFILSPSEEAAALAAMSVRDAALFRFLLATGARISEALGIRVEQCTEEGTMVLCPVLGKGGKARTLRVAEATVASVREAFGGAVWLFETRGGKPIQRDYAYKRIAKTVRMATGKGFSPHCARHTFATRALERTGKIKAVSEYLGHASAAITLDMYTHEELTDGELSGM